MKTKKGNGDILINGEKIFSGKYNIIQVSDPDTQTKLSGTFKVSGIEGSILIDMFNSPPRDLILVEEEGREFYIQLLHIPGTENFKDGSVEFKIVFLPRNTGI